MELSHSYERVLPLRKTGAHLRRLILIGISYPLVALSGILVSLMTANPTILLFAIALLVCLVLLTRKQFSVEYEYSFFGNVLSLAKILGKSSRKAMAEFELKQLRLVDYDTADARLAAERLRPQKTIDIRADVTAPSLLLVYEREDGSRVACLIETDDETEKILRRSVPEVCSLSLKRGARPTETNKR